MTNKFPGWPVYGDEEVAAAEAVLRSGKVNYWTGTKCREFEEAFADFVGVRHAVAVSNGTTALECALRALEIGPGDEVIVPPRSFVATAIAPMLCGATPIFADLNPYSGNVCAETIQPMITERTKAVICVHLAGWPCEMDAIMTLAEERGIFVIEDCAQAHGAEYRGRMVGAIGHINAFSFCQDKIMSTGGEGGMVTTNDEALWKKAWSWKDHGKGYDAVYHTQHPPGFRWLHEGLGTNARMTEMQGAIGLELLKKLPDWLEKRRIFAAVYDECFRGLTAVEVLQVPTHMRHAYYKYYMYLNLEQLKNGCTVLDVVSEVNALGIPCFSGSCCEMYEEGVFQRTSLAPEHRLPKAAWLSERSVMLLLHPTLEEEHIRQMAAGVRDVVLANTAMDAG